MSNDSGKENAREAQIIIAVGLHAQKLLRIYLQLTLYIKCSQLYGSVPKFTAKYQRRNVQMG
jgi:hypothetical protein